MQSPPRGWRPALALAILVLGALTPAWAAPPRSLLRVDDRFRNSPGLEQYPKAQVLFLQDDIGFQLEPDGHTVYTEHDAVKLLTDEGVEGYGSVVRYYRRGLETIEIELARTVGPDGRVLDVPPAAIRDVPLAPDAPLYADHRRLSVEFPQVRPGSVVEFRLRTRRAPRPDGRWWASSYVQNPDPILHSTYTVTVPGGTELRWAAPGLLRPKPQQDTVQDGQRVLRWEVRDVPALVPEPGMPGVDRLLQRIEITNFPDWKSVGAWLEPRWKAALAQAEGLDIVATGIARATDPLPQRVQAVLDWAAAGRTVTTAIPENFEPHSVRQVLDARIVTPMDMAVLIASVLSRLGVEARPVLVSDMRPHELEADLPDPETVERVVLALPDGQGSFLWVDPTAPGTLLTAPPAGAEEVAAVRLDPAGPAVISTPGSRADDNLRDIRIDARLEPQGQGELTMTLSARGLAGALWTSLTRELANSPASERDQLLTRLFGLLAQGFVAEGRVYSHFFPEAAEPEAPFQLSLTMMFQDLASPDPDATALALPLALYGGDRLLGFAREAGPRKFPAHFEYPFRDDLRVHVTLPQGSVVQKMPEPVSVDTPLGSYFATARREGLDIWFYSRLVLKRSWVGPQDFDMLRRLADAQASVLSSPVLFTAPPASPKQEEP